MKNHYKRGNHNNCDFEHFPHFWKKKSKKQLLSAKKVEKIADNKSAIPG